MYTCVCAYRSAKPRCRPSFRQIQIHLEIASQEWLSIPEADFAERQASDFVAYLLIRQYYINLRCGPSTTIGIPQIMLLNVHCNILILRKKIIVSAGQKTRGP